MSNDNQQKVYKKVGKAKRRARELDQKIMFEKRYGDYNPFGDLQEERDNLDEQIEKLESKYKHKEKINSHKTNKESK